MLEVIKKRRSIRSFTSQEVTEEEIRQLLEAAMAAPSASNYQPWHFVVVRDKGLREKLSQTTIWSSFVKDSPVAIAVCGDEQISDICWIEDTSAATENILLAAAALGLGSCWVAVREHSHDGMGAEEYVKEILGIPTHIRVLCLIAIGHPAQEKPPRTQFDPSKIHYEQF